jgi:tripartite-type tricarboxylate transporter receptor subunit TctC
VISCQAKNASAWYGVGAPKNTPAEIIDKLNMAITAATAYPKLCKLIGHLPLTSSKPVNSIIRAKILLHPG